MLLSYWRKCWFLTRLREYLQRMLLMQTTFGLIRCRVIQRVYPNMNHHMSSRQRKGGKRCVITRKQPKSRKCSIHSSTLVGLHSNMVLVRLMPLHTGLPDLTTLLTTDHHLRYLLVDLVAITTIKIPVVPHLVQTGTILAETRLEGIITGAVEVTAAVHFLHKVEVHHMAPVLAVAMVLDRLTTHKVVVSMVALEEDRIQWVVLETNDMEDGNSKQRERELKDCLVIWCGLGSMSQRQL